jgi:hypothetical protein
MSRKAPFCSAMKPKPSIERTCFGGFCRLRMPLMSNLLRTQEECSDDPTRELSKRRIR